MIRAGVLTEDDPVELLEGWLVQKMPKNPSHRIAKRRTVQALGRGVPPGWFVEEQEPLTTLDSEPEPDVMVVRGASDDYHDRHPSPEDVALIVEVSDTTLSNALVPKKRIYARAAVPIYWLLNLPGRVLEVYSDPTGPSDNPDYRQRMNYGPDQEVSLLINGREVGRIRVSDLLP